MKHTKKYIKRNGQKTKKNRTDILIHGNESRQIDLGEGQLIVVPKKLDKLCEKIVPRTFQPFVETLEKTPLYKDIRKIDKFEQKLVKRLNIPFTPSCSCQQRQ